MSGPTKRRGKRCPVCGRPVAAEHRPFCSTRCAEEDLGRWLGGTYRIPGEPADAEDMAQAFRRSANDDDKDGAEDDET